MDYIGADTVLTFINQDPWESTVVSTLTLRNRLLDPNAIDADSCAVSAKDAYGNWAWFERWVDRVRDHCAAQGENPR